MKEQRQNAYRSFWSRWRDYKGTSTLREFWIPTGVHFGLALAALICYLMGESEDSLRFLSIPFWILIVYLTVSLIPFAALTVRRLHDTGASGLWALLLLFVGAGTIAVLCLCGFSSGFNPAFNEPVSVYGPPEWFESSGEFDPAENDPVDIYGPPEWFVPTEEDETESEEFDSSGNIAVPLYGPPAGEGDYGK